MLSESTYFLVLDALIDLTEMLEEALKELHTVRQVFDSHHFTATMHRQLRHASVYRPNAGSGRNDWANGASTRAIVAN